MAVSSVGQLLNTHSSTIEETISKTIEEITPSIDPVFEAMVTMSEGPQRDLGRDWKITKFYEGVESGVIEAGNFTGNANLFGETGTDVSSRIFTQNVSQTWPDPRPMANAKRFGLRTGMNSWLTNLMFEQGELQAEANENFIGEIVAPKFRRFARNLSRWMVNGFYTAQANNYRLALVGDASAPGGGALSGGTGATPTLAFSPQSGEIDRFYVGQLVDIMSSANLRRNDTNTILTQSRSTRVNAIVTGVDELRNRVTITLAVNFNSATLQGGAGTTVVAGDYIVYANSGLPAATAAVAFQGYAGLNSWYKTGSGSSDNYLLGDDKDSDSNYQVDVTAVGKEFLKSMRKNSVGALTEDKLGQYLNRFHRAKDKYGYKITDLVCSDGIIQAYLQQKYSLYQYDRTGRLNSATSEGYEKGFKFSYDGRTYNMHASTFVELGRIYGVNLSKGNWIKYVVPDPERAKKGDGSLTKHVPFRWTLPISTGGALTSMPIRLGVSAGSYQGITQGWEMPGMFRFQTVCKDPCGMILDGVNYAVTYADY